MLLPEFRKLNAFIAGDSFDEEEPIISRQQPAQPRKLALVKRPGRPKAVRTNKPRRSRKVRIPKELRPKRLAKAKKSRGRPRRKGKPMTEVAERQNPLEELRKNLARLRDE